MGSAALHQSSKGLAKFLVYVVLCIQVEGSLPAVVWFTGGERSRCSGKAAAAAITAAVGGAPPKRRHCLCPTARRLAAAAHTVVLSD